MRRHIFILLSFFGCIFSIFAQDIQSPEDFLGYELGTRFTRHHQVVDYYNHIAKASNLVVLEKYGETNEHRKLQVAYVSTPENLQQLETIRTAHLANAGIGNSSASADKAIVWLSYNVHGNESSSTEASMKTIYELITTKKAWLQNTIVIIDPCLNPDGRDRYVNWYNQVASVPYNIAQKAKEHNEPWPGGRPNHYLFDLNRDWAWATQVETRQRLKVYNKWLPHVHVDFHEQGINEPYYFAPAAEPFHEVITQWQRDFQTQIGRNHSNYFDKEGWLYFTKERFDLFYPSYGDTYPTFNGAIGMTYEQAGHGMAGLAILNDEGDVLTLKDRIAHHHTTGLSTVEIASKNAAKINSEFNDYFKNGNFTYKSYVLGGHKDKISNVKALLDKHEISYGFAKDITAKGFDYASQTQKSTSFEDALIVSTNQPKGKMVKVLFEPKAKLSDSLTYDITAWSIPYAYGLQTIASKNLVTPNQSVAPSTSYTTASPNAYAYVLPWNSMQDATFLGKLLQENIRVRFTEKPLRVNGKTYDRGTLIMTRGDNKKVIDFDAVVTNLAKQHKRELAILTSGFTNTGTDIGSPDIKEIKPQKIAVLSGKYTSSLSFGEVWYFFEQELQYPVTNIDCDDFSASSLRGMHTLVIPNGYYGSFLNEDRLNVIKNWVRKGGKVIAIQNALDAFADKEGFGLKTKKAEEDNDSIPKIIPYAKSERESVKDYITGAIFKTKLDTTHPFAFGYTNDYYTLKLGAKKYDYLKTGYTTSYIEDATVISGFAGSNAIKGLDHTLVFGEQPVGNGSMLYMVDNPLFRAFWQDGKLFFANALFFVNNNSYEL